MMDESWDRIHRERRSVPSGSDRHETPTVPHPECPTHCRRHEPEATLRCPKGHGAPYVLVAHEWLWTEGHYFYTIEPLEGAPAKANGCPLCGDHLRRV